MSEQENEINELIFVNEEMQIMLSAKEDELREILEKSSAYRAAVESDSKEKDDLHSEEIDKREILIKDLQMTNETLRDELALQTRTFCEVLNDVQNFETSHVRELLDINEMVACLLEKVFAIDEDASLVCQSISVKLEASIATIREKDYTRYISCLNIDAIADDENPQNAEGTFRETGQYGKSFSSSIDEGRGYSVFSSSDGERNDYTITDNAGNGSALSSEFVNPEQFSSDDFRSDIPIAGGNNEFYEVLEEDFGRLLQEVQESPNDGSTHEYLTREAVVKILGELSKYQFLYREKDAEVQHWMRKHKLDTDNLQSILEEQERVEAKTSECLAELQSELEKLRQRNKFLESEIDFAKKQGEDDVSNLKESFQKNLNAERRRQSQSLLFAEESARSELAALEEKNAELEKENKNLRRQVEKHRNDIKTWVSDMLRLSEDDYNAECHSIAEVLARLHKIIVDNNRKMNELQEEIEEYKQKVYEPSLSDALSRSWGGSSWNSTEMQKDFCRHCKQTKWQSVLKGSFDLVEASLDEKQEEVKRLVDTLDYAEPRYRKKKSLKESLELADEQLEHLQRLSRQEFGSLDTLPESSLEMLSDAVDGPECELGDDLTNGKINDTFENEISDHLRKSVLTEDQTTNAMRNDESNTVLSGETLNGQNDTEILQSPNSKEITTEPNKKSSTKDASRDLDDSWKNIHVSPRLLTQFSILSDPESDSLQKDFENNGFRSNENSGVDRSWGLENTSQSEDNYGQWSTDEDRKEQEEEQDRVNVVNLYRSLILESSQPEDLVDGCKLEAVKSNSERDSEMSLEDKNCNQENNPKTNQFVIAPEVALTVPKIVVEQDLNENFLEILDNNNNRNNFREAADEDGCSSQLPEREFHELVDENSEIERNSEVSVNQIGKCSPECLAESDESVKLSGEVDNESGVTDSNFSVAVGKGHREMQLKNGIASKEILQPVFASEDIFPNLVKPQSMISKSLSISTGQKNSTFEFVGHFDDETAPVPTGCTHCTENFENLKSKLLEILSNQGKEQEYKNSRQLEDTKSELNKLQNEYEKLDKICEEYRNYVDEFSGRLRCKNDELRKLKVNSGIMKTEIEWLRQALGITRNYSEF